MTSPAKDPAPAPPGGPRTAVFAAGCFWCTEAVFAELAGVLDVVSGYAGGTAETANYESVCSGTTGHAECVQVTYDPRQIDYARLLDVYFATHDPTTPNRQGPDSGTQYRSAIFFATEEERRIAEETIRRLDASRAFPAPIVTRLEPLTAFYPAEDYHQDYAERNPGQPYIRVQAAPKVDKVRRKFGDLLRGE